MNVSAPSGGMNLLFASAQDGIQRAVKQADGAARQLARGEIAPQPVMDLSEAAVLVKLNAITLRTGDEMLGTLLDTKR